MELTGWIQEKRDLGGILFLQLRHGVTLTQLTIKKGEDVHELARSLTPETVVRVTGETQENPKAPRGIELRPSSITVLAAAEPDLPITPEATLPKRLDWRCLDLRQREHHAIFRIQSALVEGMRSHLLKEDFTQVFTPCVLGVASESGSEVFPLIYFSSEAFLRQDPQLHRQLAIAGGLTRIFDIGPAWRAEQSHTNRHLCEHRVCAVELAFIEDETDTMRVEEQAVTAALQHVHDTCTDELAVLGLTLQVPKTPFPVFRFPDLYELLREKGKDIKDGDDLDTDAEGILWDHVQATTDSEFYFVTGFPSKKKPFYVMTDGKPYARSVDLYFRGLELSSGGQREHRYDEILKNATACGTPHDTIEWFTRHFKYGVPPHGGFAIGIERLTQSLLSVENIRDCALFPRDPERLVP